MNFTQSALNNSNENNNKTQKRAVFLFRGNAAENFWSDVRALKAPATSRVPTSAWSRQQQLLVACRGMSLPISSTNVLPLISLRRGNTTQRWPFALFPAHERKKNLPPQNTTRNILRHTLFPETPELITTGSDAKGHDGHARRPGIRRTGRAHNIFTPICGPP